MAQPTLPGAAAPAAPGGGSLDALMADLDSFSQREEEERQAREVTDRQAREEGKLKAQAEAERRAQEDAERQMREQLERERASRKNASAATRKSAAPARKRAPRARSARGRGEPPPRGRGAQAQGAGGAPREGAPLPDIEVSDKDLDMTEVRHDEAAVAREARKAQREREREARQRAKEAKEHAKAAAREQSVKYPKMRRKVNWGRPVAITLLTLLAAGLVALHVIPLPMDEYERAASDALGRPVKIGTGRLSLYSGLRLNLENVSVDGATTIARARAYPQLRALVEGRQAFGRLELERRHGAAVRRSARRSGRSCAATASAARASSPRTCGSPGRWRCRCWRPRRSSAPDGAVASVMLSGPESLIARLTPTANGEVEFDVTAASLHAPVRARGHALELRDEGHRQPPGHEHRFMGRRRPRRRHLRAPRTCAGAAPGSVEGVAHRARDQRRGVRAGAALRRARPKAPASSP